MNRAAIYARFSSEKQNERSIEDQIAVCRDLCNRQGYNVVFTFDDRAVSGASIVNRQGWLALMRAADRREFDILVAEDIDRLFRDQADFHGARKRLKFREIKIHTVHGGIVSEIEGSVRAMLAAQYLENLAQKTHRGQAGAVRRGGHVGGRSYGYRPVPGQPGKLAIVEAEADIVRRIFNEYVSGRSPREIAIRVNREGIPGPRGGIWNASSIGGSRARQNGVLQNALYSGEIVWNRQRFIKDPETGRRVSRLNPETEWVRYNAPELQIVDADLFQAARAIKADRGGDRPHKARPKHLLSGLLKCGCCGSGYIVISRDKRGLVLGCSRVRETGLCDNRRTVSLTAIESLVIEGVEKHLGAPDLIAEYVREYRLAWEALHDGERKRRADLQRHLDTVKSDAAKVVDLLLQEGASLALRERLRDLERKRAKIEDELIDVPPPVIEFHPNLPESYRKKIKDLKALLESVGEEHRMEAFTAIRELVERIVIRPTGPYKPVDIDVHGRLAALLRASEGAAFRSPRSVGRLVAGVGFEPTTFRL
jgi:site-specific DNA recombinase